MLQYADISHAGMEQSHPYSNVRAAPASPQAATEYSEVKKPWQVGKLKEAAGRISLGGCNGGDLVWGRAGLDGRVTGG